MKKKQKKALFNADDVVEKLRHHQVEDYTNGFTTCIDPPSYEKFVDAQTRAATKKYRSKRDKGASLRSAAINKFKAVNMHIGLIDHLRCTQPYSNLRDPFSTDFYSRILGRARTLARIILEDFNDDIWFSMCRHSSGTSLGLKYSNTSLADKMVLPMSATFRAAQCFNMYLLWDTDLRNAISESNLNWRFQFRDYSHYELVESSRLTTVPKNDETDRTIAIEPTVNMFLQQGLGRYISDRLVQFGVDIESQQNYHQVLAYYASIDNRLATIDFSSASDCVGIQLLKQLLPPKWFYVVDMVRCDKVDIDGEILTLNSIATMGNATTFPLETLVFYCLALAVESELSNKYGGFTPVKQIKHPTISVFGDDCIMPSRICQEFMAVATHVGFIVNSDKSYFGSEFFRESCGGDYFHGRNVRGLYFKAPRSNKSSVLKAWAYTMYNMVLKKHIQCFGPLLYVYRSSSLAYLAKLISDNFKDLEIVPDHFPDDSGLKHFGDWQRVKHNFQKNNYAVSKDRHGTYIFRYLRSVVLPGTCTNDSLNYWRIKKYPVISPSYRLSGKYNHGWHYESSLLDFSVYYEEYFFASLKKQKFEASKREGGYVNSRSTDCGSDLQALLIECRLRKHPSTGKGKTE